MAKKPLSRKDSDELDQNLSVAFWTSNDPIRNADKERRRLAEADPDLDDVISEGWGSLFDDYED